LAFSVKLWPPRAPVESPVLVSGIVLSVDAIVVVVESSLMCLYRRLVYTSVMSRRLNTKCMTCGVERARDEHMIIRQRHDVK
jgi:hypothetical protein